MTYEDLLIEAEEDEITVIEKTFKSKAKGLCKGNKIAINRKLHTAEKVCILAEEIGHYETTVGDILDQKNVSNIKQEVRARAWAYNKLIPIEYLKRAFDAGYITTYEIAEYLNVEENFLKSSLDHYIAKYGESFFTQIDEDAKLRILFGGLSSNQDDELKRILSLLNII